MKPSEINVLWRGDYQQYWWGNPLDVRYHLCAELAGIRGKRVLDVGCNVGIISGQLHASNSVIGVDLDKKALALAKKRFPTVTYLAADMFTLEKRFAKGSFDVIILSHVLPKDNFPSPYFPEELLDRIVPLLRKGGTLYVTTPSVERCYNRRSKFINRPYLDALLARYDLDAVVQHWGPWSIHLNRFLQFIPGIWGITEYLARYPLRSGAFYVKARRR